MGDVAWVRVIKSKRIEGGVLSSMLWWAKARAVSGGDQQYSSLSIDPLGRPVEGPAKIGRAGPLQEAQA